MSAITPQTELKLLKVPIELDNLNQIKFSNANDQYNYFNSLDKLEVDDFTYQRKDSTIRYPANIDSIINYNYVMYKNENFSNKWFYAFITDMEFINPNMTLISIKTDVWNTWQFDLTFKKCYVEREHVSSDKYHEHILDEGLSYGDYTNNYITDFSDIGTCHPVMATTINPKNGTSDVSGGVYGGIYSGASYYVFRDKTALQLGLSNLASGGRSDAIVGIFLCPDWLTNYNNITFDADGIAPVTQSTSVTSATGILVPLTPTVMDGYTPKNKKLFNYPYCSYVLSNNSGNEIELKLEDFLDNVNHRGKINVYGTITPGCSIRAIPENYKVGGNTLLAGGDENEYGLTMGKFPICSYDVDMYTNWLTQNSVNITIQAVESLGSIALGAAEIISGAGTLGGASMIASGIGGVINTFTGIEKASLTPDAVRGNTNSGDITYASGKLTYSGYFKTLKKEYAKMIDDYFTMFGYKVNSLKIPNLHSRTNWNYVKTVDCNIEGYIPQQDLQEIKNMFNNGITLWHTTNYFLDYSQSNNIIA